MPIVEPVADNLSAVLLIILEYAAGLRTGNRRNINDWDVFHFRFGQGDMLALMVEHGAC